MNVPDWWEAVLLALAGWRVFQLVAFDDVLDPVWGLVPKKVRENEKFVEFTECPYCAGFWIVLAWWGAWQLWEHGTLVAATVFALSAGVVAAHKLLGPE